MCYLIVIIIMFRFFSILSSLFFHLIKPNEQISLNLKIFDAFFIGKFLQVIYQIRKWYIHHDEQKQQNIFVYASKTSNCLRVQLNVINRVIKYSIKLRKIYKVLTLRCTLCDHTMYVLHKMTV